MQPPRRRAPHSLLLRLAGAVGLAALLGAAPGREVHAGPGSGVAVTVVPVSGAPVAGTFAGCTAEAVLLEGRDALALDGVREVRFAPDAPPPALPEKVVGLRLVLRGGEELRGTLVGADAEGLEVKPPDLPAQKVLFEQVRRIETERPGRSVCDEPARFSPPRSGSDVAYTTSGDAFPGTLDRASPEGVVLDREGEKRAIAWADLVVLHVDEPALPEPAGRTAELDTIGGSRLAATSIEGDAKALRVTTRSGLVVEVPREAVAAIRWWGGAFTYASRLPFTSEWTPFYEDTVSDRKLIAELHRLRVDRTLDGCPLRVAGTTFRHGFAVRAKTVVTIPLDGAYASFQTRFGIDDEALAAKEGVKGDVTARVLVDGKPLWTSAGSVKGGEAARTIGPLDVRGAKALVLEVDFGEGLQSMDRGDWGDPVLVRAPK